MLATVLGIVLLIALFYGGAWFAIRALALVAYPFVALGAWFHGESEREWGSHAWTDTRLAYLLLLFAMSLVGWLLGK